MGEYIIPMPVLERMAEALSSSLEVGVSPEDCAEAVSVMAEELRHFGLTFALQSLPMPSRVDRTGSGFEPRTPLGG